ncbi:MAG: CDP-alcohol phosphatidyltransferase family protein [Desulfobacterales bacterium]|nr:CDP-alcohol phosphatidyltransferase family protein [Desulfobacterales bacterium]
MDEKRTPEKQDRKEVVPFSINIPNTLTLLRILLTPLFVIFLLKHEYGHALAVFVVAGITDGLDGAVARYRNQRTVIGAFLDPIADKLLIASAFACLAVLRIVPSWLAVVVISRDVVIFLGVAIFGIFHIDFKVRPARISKVTTCLQLLTAFLVLLYPTPAAMFTVKFALYWTTACLTILSGLHYLYLGMSLLQNALEEEEKEEK